MNVYIVGICGTFMGGLARLARDLGMQVSGSDANTYPPMSTQLESLGISLYEGYRAENIPNDTDIVIVGNTISRGNPELEYVLDKGLRYTSGAQWLGENVLHGRWVLGVAGTHGKTTTSSMLAWLLEDNQLKPGYLIGGVPENFGESARLGDTPFFIIEADEYDTAFCDKRSKFIHYQPRTLVLNNLEFDHADIFADLSAIQTQFHHLIKTIPQHGQIIHNQQAAAHHVGIKLEHSVDSLSRFKSVKRRMEKIFDDGKVRIFDDFAHHPTAITETLRALRNNVGTAPIIAVLEPRSNTMKRGVHKHLLADALSDANKALIYADENVQWDIRELCSGNTDNDKAGNHRIDTYNNDDALLTSIISNIGVYKTSETGPCNVLIMSNGGFNNLYQRLIDKLS